MTASNFQEIEKLHTFINDNKLCVYLDGNGFAKAISLPYWRRGTDMIVQDTFYKIEGFIEAVPLPYMFEDTDTMTITKDLPEMGFLKSIPICMKPLPYEVTRKLMLVTQNAPEEGYMKSVSLYDKPNPCYGCFYATQSKYLPCTVDPLAYGEGCSHFST